MAFFSKELFQGFNTKGTGFIQGGRIGYDIGMRGGLPFAIAAGAYGAISAPRGHAISKGVSATVVPGMLSLAGGIVGTMLAGPIGGYVGAFAGMMLAGEASEKAMSSGLQSMVDFGSNMRRVQFGGDYRDTQMALTMRQVASREMSRSLVNARQWLGQEGAFMHQ
jgi:hypothetical protein